MNEVFGSWINNIDELNKDYKNSRPFKHIVIDNFLNENYVEKVHDSFPNNFDTWYKYWNPIEVKYLDNRIDKFDKVIQNVFEYLGKKEIVNIISKITDIEDLEKDDFLHGAGLHAHPKNGRLMIHLDYEKHPHHENKQRRLNIILYLTKDWKKEWNGETELWDEEVKKCEKKIDVVFNRAILFQTNELSWHGLPEKIKCPDGVFRKSLAYYYISPLVNNPDKTKTGASEDGYRKKATFVYRPMDENKDKIQRFLDIRPHRRIENKDMLDIWPEWNEKNY